MDANCQGQLNLNEVARQYAVRKASPTPEQLTLNGVPRSINTRSGLTYSSFKLGPPVHVTSNLSQQGLGFEPILGSSGRHFSARYGPRPKVQLPYPIALMGTPWPARAFELNQYLLDGINPDGTPCQYRQTGLHFPDKSVANQFQLSKHELLRMVVNVSVRICQLFVDGNHRTAILSIYKKLADAGRWLDMSATDLYILISNRNQADWSMIKVRIVKKILGHLKHEPDVPVHARQIYAGRVKLIAEINTLFEDVEAFLTSPGPNICEKRMKWRHFCRRSRRGMLSMFLCMVAHPSSDNYAGDVICLSQGQCYIYTFLFYVTWDLY